MTRVSFDRAASFYDETRCLPAAARDAVTTLLAAELADRARCLEIGVGTGRIALPLALRGVDLIGVDVAPAMLARLRANAGGEAPFPLVLADVTALPLTTGSCGAVIACHVLHLVADWKALLDESVRVLGPGGSILIDFGGGAPAPWNVVCRDIMEGHGISHIRPGLSDPQPASDHLGGVGRGRALAAIHFPVERTLEQDLHDWENQIHAWTWPYRPDQMRAACADIRRHGIEQGWSFEEPATLDAEIRWWSFDLTG